MEKFGVAKKLTPSATEIYELLKKGPSTSKHLLKQTSFAPRTLRYALKRLLSLKMIKKYPNFSDLRQSYYVAVDT
ncbi:MAG: ArsR family transcriptional regulator [Candidatus Helarchaeota archaeon]